MPSSRAIACAVTAWSPVIMRTWMPAACAVGDRRLGRRARRVDDADQREHREPVHQRRAGRRPASNAAGSKSLRAVAITRRPCARAARSRRGSAPRSRRRPRPAAQRRVQVRGRAGEQLVGRALDEAADHRLAVLVGHAVERGHQLVGRVERQLGDARVALARGARGRGRPSRRARRARPRSGRRSSRRSSVSTASQASASGSMNGSSGTSGSPATCLIWPSVE